MYGGARSLSWKCLISSFISFPWLVVYVEATVHPSRGRPKIGAISWMGRAIAAGKGFGCEKIWKNVKTNKNHQESVSESQKGWSLSSCQIPVWAKSPSEWSELGLACAEMLRLRPLRTTFRPFPPVLTESQFEHPRYLVLSSCKLASHASACSDTMDSRFDTHDSHKVHMSYSHTVCYSVLYCTRVFTTLVLECTTMCCDMLCTFICFAVPI